MGEVKINGKDLWGDFRGKLVKGAYETLLKPAPMKEYISNNSRLQHGKKIIVHAPVTDSRDISLQFFIQGVTETDYLTNVEMFLKELETGLVKLSVTRLNTVYKLVYTECSNYGDYGLKKGKFTVKFTEPNTKDRETIR